MSLVLAGAIISIALNPFAFATIGPARDFIKKRWAFARRMDARIDPMSLMPDSVGSDILHGHVVLVGYGEKGKIILDELLQRHLSVVVVDDHHAVVEELREKKVNSIYATRPIRRFSFKLISTKRLFSFLPSITRSSAARLWKRPRSFVRRLKRSCLLKMRKTLKL